MSTETIFLQEELQKRLNQISQLQSHKRKFIRAHQTLPRWRRRRQMSWNFKRFPQSLRPRALQEIMANKPNISSKDNVDVKSLQPKQSRKYRRTRLCYKLPRFIGKRCKVLKLLYSNIITRLTVKYNTKVTRFLERSECSVIDRSMSFYTVIKVINIIKNDQLMKVLREQNIFTEDFTVQMKQFVFLPGDIPSELISMNDDDAYFVVYRVQLDNLRNTGLEFVISEYVNCVVFNVEPSKYSDICDLFKNNSVNNHVVFSNMPYNAFRQPKAFDQSEKQDLRSQIKLYNAQLLSHDYLEQMTSQFRQRLIGLIKRKQDNILKKNNQIDDAGIPLTEYDQSKDINQIFHYKFSNLILSYNSQLKILSILTTPECMHLLYQRISPVAGAVEKRFLCYSAKIIDLLQCGHIEQLEKLIYKSQVPKQFHQINKKKCILTDTEVVKNIFMRSKTYMRIESKILPQQYIYNNQEAQPLNFKEFSIQNFTFQKDKLTNMKKLFIQKYGREIGISPTGEIEKKDIIL